MRRAFFPALAALGVGTGVASGACSILAGYEDLRYVPADTDTDSGDATVVPPLDLGAATIYSVYPSIFSPAGDLAGVTAQLGRIHELGFNVLSLMPVTPIGEQTDGHVSFQSPYCVHDYYAINPAYGSASDLTTLVQNAHRLGMYVLLDEQINQTAWDNALIASHPEYYRHSDMDPTNVASIEEALGFADVAQLDYLTSGTTLPLYMTTMLEDWLTTYGVDGFRFLTADVAAPAPSDGPLIPPAFWRALRTSLETVNPHVVMWADEEDTTLAGAPFEIDYGWVLRGGLAGATGGAGLQQVANGADATQLQQAWAQQTTGYSGVRHATFLETWDFDEDVKVYGGAASTMAAATFDFTIDGIPMLWNGEEVANGAAGPDTHAAIDWNGASAASFTAFYGSLLGLRNGSTALQQGATAWIPNSSPQQVVSYTRADPSATFLVLISFSAQTTTGTLTLSGGPTWSDVSPTGSPGGRAHAAPPAFSLAPYDFAVFRAQ